MEQGDPSVKDKEEEAISDVGSGIDNDHLPVKTEVEETWAVKLEVDIAVTPLQCWPKIPSDSQGEYRVTHEFSYSRKSL